VPARVWRMLPHRGHYSSARIGSRACLCDQDCTGTPGEHGAAGQSFRARRQGHEHGRRTHRAQVLLPPRMRSGATMNRIDATFAKLRAAGRAALIPYITVGDPSLAATVPLMRALTAAGADVIELGVPFSDPMADGPVIPRASER